MLKALELAGFKSFADKTRFEFPRGITSVVGPNGSGKSNVVDAIKWVLGEQSVKSLRGKEMADIIFNGSGSRQGVNAAEATLTFDNAEGVLAVDAPEVHITRRVYRSGEGEYLINRQPCRLRDIRDLLSGTGVGTEAYSIIEQGKVDVMLQASPRDRRALFEEAAGIGRFKAKKIESLRRLERVEQNLTRLSDIVDEVENRLRSVRLQASKARRYKEHADRLQELRTQVGLADWRRLSERLAALERQRTELAERHGAATVEAESLEAQASELEAAAADSADSIREIESQVSENRERIAKYEASIDHERTRSRDAEEETSRYLRQLATSSVRAGDLQQQLQETAAAVSQAEEAHSAERRQLAVAEQSLGELSANLDVLRAEYEDRRTGALEATRVAAALETEAAALSSQCESARAVLAEGQREGDELQIACQALAGERELLAKRQRNLASAVEERAAQSSAAGRRAAELRERHAAVQQELGGLRQRHSGMTERASLLEELEQRHEGVEAGVREVLARIEGDREGLFRQVRGLVADLLQVSVEMAPLVELALGERTQYFVIEPDDDDWSALLAEESRRFAGRVGFISVADGGLRRWEQSPDLSGQPGVRGRADQFVEAAAPLAPLVERLFSRIWVVETLPQARRLAQSVGRGLTLITLSGELLSPDGALTVGPRNAAAGLISRRSESRALKLQIGELAGEIAATADQTLELERQAALENQRVETLAGEHQQALDALAEHRLQVNAADSRWEQLTERLSRLDAERHAADGRLAQNSQTLATVRQRLEAAQERLGESETTGAAVAARMADIERRRARIQREATAGKVELAKSEERLTSLLTRRNQFEQDRQERRRSLAECREQLAQTRRRATRAQANILDAESHLAGLYLRKEALARETAATVERRDVQRARRARLVADAQAVRVAARKLEEQQHAKELAANEIRHERGAMADRLRDDYQIELAESEQAPSDEELHRREEVDHEIAELRRKLNNIGNVNLDALAELEDLESRFAKLSSQFDDLTRAKDSLVQIINKINADSRRLFAETLEAVKGNFQQLFRKLFGGGHADIVLDAGVDILDSGIEIVARPPGKEPRSISLLSGGEKTLTCVALLLAIFQYRPSPFCVLDEVDAALDEANIERFIGVLQEFLAWTQFIVVTHSKKTMTCATTLYGVTMQESGVSKRVSVRFEDVSDNGEIRLPDEQGPAGDGTQAA
ncbi:MAG TPA: chromosome segregation protein SMC [Pirellulales bacterium]|nr:chromosome segregation protein SMC [Pirellulales bacterium]